MRRFVLYALFVLMAIAIILGQAAPVLADVGGGG